MRSKPVVIVLGVLCGVMVVVCLPMGLRFWRVYKTRRAFAAAVEYYNKGQHAEALEALDRCTRYMPQNVTVYRLAGYAATKLPAPDYARAREAYEAMLKYAEGDDAVEAHVALGGLCLRRDHEGHRDLDQAIEHLETALEQDEYLADAHGALGIAYALKGLAGRADEHLERAWESYANAEQGGLGSAARLWQIAYMYQRGDLVSASRAFDELAATAQDVPRTRYQAALALACAFHLDDDGLSSSIREYYLQQAARVPEGTRKRHALRIGTLAGSACERVGKPDRALAHYRKALAAAPDNTLARRNLAHALYQAAERTTDEDARKKLLAESLELYGRLLKDKQLKGNDRKQVTLALASFAWNAGRKAEAEAMIQSIGSSSSALTERLQAAAAIRDKNYQQAVKHLEKALAADPNQPDVQALVQRLKAPPDIRNFRVNTLNPYDRRPLISVAFLPRALPEPIPPSQVKLSLDDRSVRPLFAKAEAFFVPESDLEPGDHKMTLTVTDTLGLTASKTLAFAVKEDKDPPQILGITPPENETTDTKPVIAFHATDPSGIAPASLEVVMARSSGPSVTIISHGRYRVGFKKGNIDKGDPVRLGAVRFEFSKPLNPGEYAVRVSATDSLGNRTTKSWSFKVQ